MGNSKQKDVKKVKVIKKVNVSETIRQIPHGETARFSRQDLGPEGSVRASVWRENSKLKAPEFTLTLVENGLFYDIARL